MIFDSLFNSESNTLDRQNWDKTIDLIVVELKEIRRDWKEAAESNLWDHYLEDYDGVGSIEPKEDLFEHISAVQAAQTIVVYGENEYIAPGNEGEEFTIKFIESYIRSIDCVENDNEFEELVYDYIEGKDPKLEIGSLNFNAKITNMFLGQEMKDPQLAMYMRNFIGQLIKLTRENIEYIFENVEGKSEKNMREDLQEWRNNHPWDRYFKEGLDE